MWRHKRNVIAQHIDQATRLCHHQRSPHIIAPEWILAILWDELARRDITETVSDWLLGQLGRDPSVGPFQVTGHTAREVLLFCAWGEPYRQLTLPALRTKLMHFSFAAQIVIGRCQQILTHWQRAGFDPFAPGGLGRHRMSPLALIATLYSQGLGKPHAHPRSHGRGRQIISFAAQIRHLWLERTSA